MALVLVMKRVMNEIYFDKQFFLGNQLDWHDAYPLASLFRLG